MPVPVEYGVNAIARRHTDGHHRRATALPGPDINGFSGLVAVRCIPSNL